MSAAFGSARNSATSGALSPPAICQRYSACTARRRAPRRPRIGLRAEGIEDIGGIKSGMHGFSALGIGTGKGLFGGVGGQHGKADWRLLRALQPPQAIGDGATNVVKVRRLAANHGATGDDG